MRESLPSEKAIAVDCSTFSADICVKKFMSVFHCHSERDYEVLSIQTQHKMNRNAEKNNSYSERNRKRFTSAKQLQSNQTPTKQKQVIKTIF